MIEEKYLFMLPIFDGDVGAGDPDNDATLYLGLGSWSTHGRQSVMAMPSLAEDVGRESVNEAAITKGKMKAPVLRTQVRQVNGALRAWPSLWLSSLCVVRVGSLGFPPGVDPIH